DGKHALHFQSRPWRSSRNAAGPCCAIGRPRQEQHVKLAVVLFNLGGPDCIESVQPFLQNLFSDPAIINLPSFLRRPLARFIAARRAPLAKKIYEHLGGCSPILPETEEQARALEVALAHAGHQAKCFIAMRCWHPFTREAVKAVKAFEPEGIVLLPLYPQYSTTTTR